VNFTTEFVIFCFNKALFNTRHSKSSISHNAHQFSKWKYHNFFLVNSLTQMYSPAAVPRKGINSKSSSVTTKFDFQTQTHTAKLAASLSPVLSSTNIEQVRQIRLLDLDRSSDHLLRQLHDQPLRFYWRLRVLILAPFPRPTISALTI